MLRINIDRANIPSPIENTSSERREPIKKYSLHDDLGVHPQAIKALVVSDYLGSKSANQIPSYLANATYSGDVVVVANSMAITAAMGQGHGKVLVADTATKNLAGVQSVLKLAESSADMESWLKNVGSAHGARYARHIGQMVSSNNEVLSFDKLQERLRGANVIFYNVDLSHPSAIEISNDANNGVSAIYASNIEMYLGGFMSNDNQGFNERLQTLELFKNNITNLMGPEAIFIHGSSMLRMEIHDRNQAINEWQAGGVYADGSR